MKKSFLYPKKLNSWGTIIFIIIYFGARFIFDKFNSAELLKTFGLIVMLYVILSFISYISESKL